MLDKARHLSDIRSPGSPPFVLSATFSFVGDDLNTVEGTYTETWSSDSRWRREIVVGGLRYIEIAGAEQQWLVYPEGFPRHAKGLPSAMSLPRSFSEFNFSEITEQTASGVVGECALTKPNSVGLRTAFCFEKRTGVLLQKNVPERRVRNIVDLSCGYGGFQKFGAYAVPYEVGCFEDRHKTMTAKIISLSSEPNMDPALFVPPPDAIELSHCTGNTVPPAFLSAPRLGYLPGGFTLGLDPQNVAWAEVWFVVDTKGKPQDLRIVRSAAKGSPKRVLNLVHGWRFSPGKCDGKPVPVPLTVEVPFNP